MYIKGHVPICVNAHCLMLEVLRYIALNALNTVQKIKVEDIKTSHNRCILKYVEDVEDRSNTHKGCNAMYVCRRRILKRAITGVY